MEDFQQKFVDEASDLVQGLEKSLINLESNPDDKIAIDGIFRVMHTLKGTASMFGFNRIEQLTHHLENIYDQIREGARKVSAEIVELTFEAIDLIKVILDRLNELNDNEQKSFDKALEGIIEISGIEPIEEKGEKTENKEFTKKKRGFYILYSPHEDIYLRGIMPYSIFFDLNDLGKYKAIPHLDKTPEPENFNPDKFFVYWDIFFITESSHEDVEDIFLFFDESDYKIYEFELEATDEDAFLKQFKAITGRQMQKGELKSILESIEKTKNIGFNKSKVIREYGEIVKKEKALKEIGKKTKEEVVKTSSSIRVSANKLDDLIINVSEFVTLYSQISLLAENSEDEKLNKSIQSLGKLSKKLRDNALDLRLVPINDISLKMHRLVRDLSGKLGKDVQFITEGMDTELDKTIIDNLEDPLMHIIRNSIDHGIEDKETRLKSNKPEKGIVRLTAFYSGAYVFIQVQDDGKGIDEKTIRKKALEKGLISDGSQLSKREIYDLIFEAGFSTAHEVSKISGRGVGMDVVKNKISDLRGEIEIDSEVGLGTSVTLKLPLTLSIIDTLKVKVENLVYLVPLSTIETCVSAKYASFIASTKKQFEYENELLPVIILRDEFEMLSEAPKEGKIVIIHQYEKKYCLLVDKVLGDHQAVVKPLGDLHKGDEFFSGVSVMGDGSLALILDTGKMMTSNKEMYNFK